MLPFSVSKGRLNRYIVLKKLVNVTKPFLPPLEEFLPLLEDIWQSKILTNNGLYNTRFCKELEKTLDVENVVTFANGTQALIAALSCLADPEKGEVITTPFTFIATSNAIIWSGHAPVFVDIDEHTLNIDCDAVEAAITDTTKAILAVHCYGTPCDLDRLKDISQKYNIPVIYDAAHAFGTKVNNRSVLQFGEMSVVSFHATKVMNTFEGGAVICQSAVVRDKLRNFANFGFQNETTIASLGLNAKMSEFNAALGLLQLRYIEQAIEARKHIADVYFKKLCNLQGLYIPPYPINVTPNYSYFPIFVLPNSACDRDEIYAHLREHGYMVRRYFYPLTCDFGIPEIEKNGRKLDISHAKIRAEQVICLPIYPDLELSDISEICNLLINKVGGKV